VNSAFDYSNPEHINLVAKLKNSVSELNWYAFRFMRKHGLSSTPRTGIADAMRLPSPPPELEQIINRYNIVKSATPGTANDIFYSTWRFLHDFDKELDNVQI
jgi:hypothetical protein